MLPYPSNLDSMTHQDLAPRAGSDARLSDGTYTHLKVLPRTLYRWTCITDRRPMKWLFRSDNHPRQSERVSHDALHQYHPDIPSSVAQITSGDDGFQTGALFTPCDRNKDRNSHFMMTVTENLTYAPGNRFLVEYLVVKCDNQWFWIVPQRVVLYLPEPTWGRGWIALSTTASAPSSCPRVWAKRVDSNYSPDPANAPAMDSGTLHIDDFVLPKDAPGEVRKEYMTRWPHETWHHIDNKPIEDLAMAIDRTDAMTMRSRRTTQQSP